MSVLIPVVKAASTNMFSVVSMDMDLCLRTIRRRRRRRRRVKWKPWTQKKKEEEEGRIKRKSWRATGSTTAIERCQSIKVPRAWHTHDLSLGSGIPPPLPHILHPSKLRCQPPCARVVPQSTLKMGLALKKKTKRKIRCCCCCFVSFP